MLMTTAVSSANCRPTMEWLGPTMVPAVHWSPTSTCGPTVDPCPVLLFPHHQWTWASRSYLYPHLWNNYWEYGFLGTWIYEKLLTDLIKTKLGPCPSCLMNQIYLSVPHIWHSLRIWDFTFINIYGPSTKHPRKFILVCHSVLFSTKHYNSWHIWFPNDLTKRSSVSDRIRKALCVSTLHCRLFAIIHICMIIYI